MEYYVLAHAHDVYWVWHISKIPTDWCEFSLLFIRQSFSLGSKVRWSGVPYARHHPPEVPVGMIMQKHAVKSVCNDHLYNKVYYL